MARYPERALLKSLLMFRSKHAPQRGGDKRRGTRRIIQRELKIRAEPRRQRRRRDREGGLARRLPSPW
jgi:hypothetical protein